jgi:hypothetical protein
MPDDAATRPTPIAVIPRAAGDGVAAGFAGSSRRGLDGAVAVPRRPTLREDLTCRMASQRLGSAIGLLGVLLTTVRDGRQASTRESGIGGRSCCGSMSPPLRLTLHAPGAGAAR